MQPFVTQRGIGGHRAAPLLLPHGGALLLPTPRDVERSPPPPPRRGCSRCSPRGGNGCLPRESEFSSRRVWRTVAGPTSLSASGVLTAPLFFLFRHDSLTANFLPRRRRGWHELGGSPRVAGSSVTRLGHRGCG